MTRAERAALQRALEEVYAGDQSLEASAVADKLEDAGMVLRFARPPVAEDPVLPVASTRGLVKRRSAG